MVHMVFCVVLALLQISESHAAPPTVYKDATYAVKEQYVAPQRATL